MTIWVLFLGLFTLFFGLLFVFTPKTLTRMSREMNRVVHKVDTQAMRHRMGVGVR
jgi:HAMP domain-containing protein